jgi:predicted transcriptional regulator|tara:strand:+ start:306 stop:992 length:687 start_codon:yes stop_codon:yes gene_type:complete
MSNIKDLVASRDTAAISIFTFLGLLPNGQAANAKEIMGYFKLGRSRFYRARKILLNAGMIVELRSHDKNGLFSGTRYHVPCETACTKTAHRVVENVHEELAQNLIKIKDKQINVDPPWVNPKTNTDDSGLISTYPKDFERVWDSIPPTFGAKGSKQLAAKEFKKLKLNADEVSELLRMIDKEIRRKKHSIANEIWEPSFPHVVRMIKGKIWESWVTTTVSPTLDEVIL